jgi:hypothetical protein
MSKEIIGPFGEWCVVNVPGYCESGMRIAQYEQSAWTDDEGVDITEWVKAYRLAPTFYES